MTVNGVRQGHACRLKKILSIPFGKNRVCVNDVVVLQRHNEMAIKIEPEVLN